MIQFTIPGQPVAKGRPKFRVMPPRVDDVIATVHTRNMTMPECIRATVAATMKACFVSTYTPSETVNYEKHVGWLAKAAMAGRPPSAAPIEVLFEFRMQIPVSWSKKKQVAASAGKVRATKKPDFDNILKGVLDACNGVVWVDDSQIVISTVRKLYHAEPCVIVAVREVEGEAA